MRRTPTSTRAAVLIGLLAVWAMSSVTFGAFTARINNNAATAGSSSTLLSAYPGTATTGTPDCATTTTSSITTTPSSCAGSSTLPASVPSNGSSSSQSITLVSSGGNSPTSAQSTAASCGPVEFVDQTASGDPMVARGTGTLAYGQSDEPVASGGGSVGLTPGSGKNALTTNITATTPNATFTEGIWFKTAMSYSGGGTLIGFGSSATDDSGEASADKTLSMDSSGHLKFTIYLLLGLTSTTTTGGTYNNNQWHLAVVVVNVTSVTIYVDGAQDGQSLSLSLLAGYAGYWHVGWSPSASFTGSLANAFVADSSAITAAHISSLYADRSHAESTWSGDVASFGASRSWGLYDNGTTPLPGTITANGGAAPCTMIAISVGSSASSFCVSPNNQSAACAALTGTSQSMATYAPSSVASYSFPATTVGSPATITTTLMRCSSSVGSSCTQYNTTFMPDLRLCVTVTYAETLTSTWSTTLTWNSTSEQVVA